MRVGEAADHANWTRVITGVIAKPSIAIDRRSGARRKWNCPRQGERRRFLVDDGVGRLNVARRLASDAIDNSLLFAPIPHAAAKASAGLEGDAAGANLRHDERMVEQVPQITPPFV